MWLPATQSRLAGENESDPSWGAQAAYLNTRQNINITARKIFKQMKQKDFRWIMLKYL